MKKLFLLKKKQQPFKINKKIISNITLFDSNIKGVRYKKAEEWIYGTMKKMNDRSIINFKNQNAFKGYILKKNNSLCK
jgi:hypothetical protein